MRSAARDHVEYFAVRAFGTLVQVLSDRVALSLGRAIGTLAYLVDRRHREVTLENLRRAFPGEPSEESCRSLARRCFQHLGCVLVECLKFPRLNLAARLDEYVTISGVAETREALAQGKGLLMISGHVGNWELSGIAVSLRVAPVVSVARPLDNALLGRHLLAIRQAWNQRIIDKRGALRGMSRTLKARGLVGVLIDQNAGRDGVFVDFFGRKASTTGSVAALALRMGCPVVPASSYRVGSGFRYHVALGKPLELVRTGDRERDVRENTAMFTKCIERFIRQHPEQWLWLHRRWKAQPPEDTDAAAQRQN